MTFRHPDGIMPGDPDWDDGSPPDAPTLGEVVAEFRDSYGGGGVLEASLYGTLSTCPECGGSGQRISSLIVARPIYENHGPCPRCQGTGKVRSGGLVERVTARCLDLKGDRDVRDIDEGCAVALAALRAELGEGP